MIDFHAHILPGADHGSDSVETSLGQLALAEKAGVDIIVATSHFYPESDTVERFVQRRARTLELLRSQYHGPVRILPGAEVHLCPGLDHLAGLEQLCVQGTDVILLELPFQPVSNSMWETLVRFTDAPLRPVLAHVDRYSSGTIESLFDLGFPGQLNAEGLCKLRGRGLLLDWIDEGQILALGSDIHGTDIGYRQWNKARKLLRDRFDTIQSRTEELLEDVL